MITELSRFRKVVKIKSLKVAVIGDSAVGKTTLLKAYFGEDIKNITTTPGIDFYSKKVSENRCVVFWDFGGQTWYREVIVEMLQGASIVVMVFDLSRPNTLVGLVDFWLKKVLENCGKGVPTFVVGNKKDKKCIDDNTIKEALSIISRELDVKAYIETTICEPQTIEKLFEEILNFARGI